MIEWGKNPVHSYHSNIIDTKVAYVTITGRGWFRTPIHTNNIRFNYINNYLVINQTDISVLNSNNGLRTYNKNINHYINFTVLELKLKLCTDTKQMNAMCGVSDGSPNQACAVCKISTQQSNSDPCPQTRNVELKDYETSIAHGLSVTRLDKDLFPNISEISVKDSEGSKFLPISYILSKDFVPCGLHYRMGNGGRNYDALQTAIVGEKVMNSNQMKKLATLDKQKYEILREIQQRTQALYLSEPFSESNNNYFDDSTLDSNNSNDLSNNNYNNDIDDTDVTVVSNQLNQLNQLNNNNNNDNENNDHNNIDITNEITDQDIINAINGSVQDLNNTFIKIENTINQLHEQLCDNNDKYKEFHEIVQEAKIRELEYRPNEVLGIDAMRLPYVYELFMPMLTRMNPQAANIAKYLFPLLKIQYNVISRKNLTPYSDEFMHFFKFITVAIDKWSLLFRKVCTNKQLAGDKHHWMYHMYHYMDHYRFSPAWMDDQRTEATMRFAMQWYKKYKNHLNKIKASTMMLSLNCGHLIEFDESNSKQLYEYSV